MFFFLFFFLFFLITVAIHTNCFPLKTIGNIIHKYYMIHLVCPVHGGRKNSYWDHVHLEVVYMCLPMPRLSNSKGLSSENEFQRALIIDWLMTCCLGLVFFHREKKNFLTYDRFLLFLIFLLLLLLFLYNYMYVCVICSQQCFNCIFILHQLASLTRWNGDYFVHAWTTHEENINKYK